MKEKPTKPKARVMWAVFDEDGVPISFAFGRTEQSAISAFNSADLSFDRFARDFGCYVARVTVQEIVK